MGAVAVPEGLIVLISDSRWTVWLTYSFAQYLWWAVVSSSECGVIYTLYACLIVLGLLGHLAADLPYQVVFPVLTNDLPLS
jgi:hypothetical protein